MVALLQKQQQPVELKTKKNKKKRRKRSLNLCGRMQNLSCKSRVRWSRLKYHIYCSSATSMIICSHWLRLPISITYILTWPLLMLILLLNTDDRRALVLLCRWRIRNLHCRHQMTIRYHLHSLSTVSLNPPVIDSLACFGTFLCHEQSICFHVPTRTNS